MYIFVFAKLDFEGTVSPYIIGLCFRLSKLNCHPMQDHFWFVVFFSEVPVILSNFKTASVKTLINYASFPESSWFSILSVKGLASRQYPKATSIHDNRFPKLLFSCCRLLFVDFFIMFSEIWVLAALKNYFMTAIATFLEKISRSW